MAPQKIFNNKTDLILGLFCFVLFFVANPNGLIGTPSTVRIFFLNCFLFAPYIYLAARAFSGEEGLKRIPIGVIYAMIILEFFAVQLKLITGGNFTIDQDGEVLSTINISIYILIGIYWLHKFSKK